MNKIKSIVAAALGLLMAGQASAHDNYNYININVGGGLSTMLQSFHDYEGIDKDAKLGFGGTFNVGYIHFFGDKFGLGTGLGLSYYQSRAIVNGLDESLEEDSYNNVAYTYRMLYSDWEEMQRAIDFELPIGFYFRHDLNERMSLLTGIGGKFTFPFYYKYEVMDGEIETRGYYADRNVEIFDLPHHGFGVDDSRYESSNDKLPGFAVYLDLGFNHWLNDRVAIYWGIYANYGITDLIKSHEKALYNINADYTGVHASNQVDKASLLAAGLKVGVTLPFGKKPEPEVKDTIFVTDTISALDDQLVLVAPDTLAEDSSWVDVAALIEKLPDWDHFNYKNKDALESATTAFSALSDSAKREIPNELREKLFNLNKNVAVSTVPNLESSLKIKSSYGFAFASSDGHFTDEEKQYMHFIADCLKMNPQAKISVIGYTCDIGSEEQNEVFGYDRAIHIKNYIVRYGAFEDQIEMDTKTSHCPIVPNTSEANRSKNRRTEIKLIAK